MQRAEAEVRLQMAVLCEPKLREAVPRGGKTVKAKIRRESARQGIAMEDNVNESQLRSILQRDSIVRTNSCGK